jgi:hypothetical protein
VFTNSDISGFSDFVLYAMKLEDKQKCLFCCRVVIHSTVSFLNIELLLCVISVSHIKWHQFLSHLTSLCVQRVIVTLRR